MANLTQSEAQDIAAFTQIPLWIIQSDDFADSVAQTYLQQIRAGAEPVELRSNIADNDWRGFEAPSWSDTLMGYYDRMPELGISFSTFKWIAVGVGVVAVLMTYKKLLE